MRPRGAHVGFWTGRLASVTAISQNKFERGRRDPADGRSARTPDSVPLGDPPHPDSLTVGDPPHPDSLTLIALVVVRTRRGGHSVTVVLTHARGGIGHVQLLLQAPASGIPHERANSGATMGRCAGTDTCSHAFRPHASLQYEHMFSSMDTPRLARRLFSALRLIRSFLLLEDDYVRDWEVDRDEPIESAECGPRRSDVGGSRSSDLRGSDGGDHPHRAPLRSRLGGRRTGMLAPREQMCLCPLPPRERRERDSQRDSRLAAGGIRAAINR